MKYWKWIKGRQHGTDYLKMCLWSFRIWKWGFDCYLLQYAPNTILDWHIDPVKNGKHYRKNIKLKGGAEFQIKRNNATETYKDKNCTWFRPDINEHMLTVTDKGCKKISFGFVRFD